MSLNKVMLIGNVGAEPEVRYVEQGVAVGSFRLATTDRAYTMQNGTQVPERTEWHNIVVWRKLAEWVLAEPDVDQKASPYCLPTPLLHSASHHCDRRRNACGFDPR